MSRQRTWSVLIAEDEVLIRRHLARKVAENCPAFEVVGEAADGQEALEAIAELNPDVLITDIDAVMDSLHYRSLYAFPGVRVVIVSGYDEFSYAKTALTLGVKDYLLKPVSEEELRSVMSRLAVQLDAEEERLDGEHPDLPGSASQDELVAAVRGTARPLRRAGGAGGPAHVNPCLTRSSARTGTALRCLPPSSFARLTALEGEGIAAMVGYPDRILLARVQAGRRHGAAGSTRPPATGRGS
jgi:AmiR/NasT family two-component response regulator